MTRNTPRTTPPTRLPPVTEKTFQNQHVIPLAKTFGWEVYHPTLSKWSARGWPDLALCRPPRLVFAELKSGRGKTTVEQEHWLNLLRAIPNVEVFVWRPDDLDTIARILR